jgi:hypothetical protein
VAGSVHSAGPARQQPADGERKCGQGESDEQGVLRRNQVASDRPGRVRAAILELDLAEEQRRQHSNAEGCAQLL